MSLILAKKVEISSKSLESFVKGKTLIELIKDIETVTHKGDTLQAISLYEAWLINNKDPLVYAGWFNLGCLLSTVNNYTAAESAYKTALEINPNLHQARINLGLQLEKQGLVDQAILEWKQVVNVLQQPPIEDVALLLHGLNSLARTLETTRRYDEAEVYMQQSLELEPDQSAVLQHYVHIRQKQCKWPTYQPWEKVSENKRLMGTSALAMLAAFDDPALQLLAARQFVHDKVQLPVPKKPKRKQQTSGRIKLGYLSGDLCMHAVGLLTVELFELHDRSKFEVFGFCWSRDDSSPLRHRIVNAFEHHIRIGHLTDNDAAKLIESYEVDILVDLQGLTSGSRPNILMQRPASIQISYLGLPGTSALPTVDYIIADPFVYPDELKFFMTEKPLYVPRCYQVSDRKRELGPAVTRASCGLPNDKFIFASFNNNYKFTIEVFSGWMRVLQQVPNSVLWLLADNQWSKQNMLDQAHGHGVAADRIIFSGRATPTEYMARLKLPDLFLDTYPYNAGTTANDILWMGTPILTCAGRSYISRMCGSLLTSVGLPELITSNLTEYERKAVQLGRNPRMIATYKKYLEEHRMESDLFNIPLLVHDLESAFKACLK